MHCPLLDGEHTNSSLLLSNDWVDIDLKSGVLKVIHASGHDTHQPSFTIMSEDQFDTHHAVVQLALFSEGAGQLDQELPAA